MEHQTTKLKTRNYVHHILIGLFFLFAFPSLLLESTHIVNYIISVFFIVYGIDSLILGLGHRRIILFNQDYLVIRDWYQNQKVYYHNITQINIQTSEGRFPSKKLIIVTDNRIYKQSDYYQVPLETIQQMMDERRKVEVIVSTLE